MAEKNRIAQATKNAQAASAMMGGAATTEPTMVAVSDIHPNVSKEDFSEVFSPFGELVSIEMPVDTNGLGLGTGRVIFKKPEDAKSAQEAINGLELAGKRIVLQLVQDAPPAAAPVVPVVNSLPNLGGGMQPGMVPGMQGMMGMLPGMPGAMAGMPGMPGMAAAMNPALAAGMAAGMATGMATGIGMPAAAATGPPSRCVRMTNMFDPQGDDEKNE